MLINTAYRIFRIIKRERGKTKMKRLFSRSRICVFLVAVLVMVLLSACSSNEEKEQAEPGTEKVNEEVTPSESNGETNATPVTETSDNETKVPEVEEVKIEIVPLYDAAYESEIRKVLPADLFDYTWFSHYCPLEATGKKEANGFDLGQLKIGSSFTLKASPSVLKHSYIALENKTYDAQLYFYERFGYAYTYYEIEGNTGTIGGFAPLFYNKTRGCLAGYTYTYKSSNGGYVYSLVEYYYDPSSGKMSSGIMGQDLAYPEEYGYTAELTDFSASKDEIIPLYGSEYESTIRDISPEEFFDYDKYVSYCPAAPADVEGYSGLGLVQLVNESTYTLRPNPQIENTDTKTSKFEYYFYDAAKATLTGDEKWSLYLESMKKKATDSGMTLGEYYKNLDADYDGVLSGFAPLYYNKTRECLVGYSCVYDGEYEVYTYPFVEMFISGSQQAEKSKYGFGMEPVNAASIQSDIIPDNASIIPLFKSEYESEVKQASRLDLFKFDRFEKYFPIATGDKGDNMYKLECDRPITLKVEPNMIDFNGVTVKSITIGVYFEKTSGETEIEAYYELNGEMRSMGSFVPLFYNEVKGCLVGYVPEMENLVERYCEPNGNGLEGYGDIALERYGL